MLWRVKVDWWHRDLVVCNDASVSNSDWHRPIQQLPFSNKRWRGTELFVISFSRLLLPPHPALLESLKASFSPHFSSISVVFCSCSHQARAFCTIFNTSSVHLMRLAPYYAGVFHNTTFVFCFSLAIRVISKMQLTEKNVHSVVWRERNNYALQQSSTHGLFNTS